MTFLEKCQGHERQGNRIGLFYLKTNNVIHPGLNPKPIRTLLEQLAKLNGVCGIHSSDVLISTS